MTLRSRSAFYLAERVPFLDELWLEAAGADLLDCPAGASLRRNPPTLVVGLQHAER